MKRNLLVMALIALFVLGCSQILLAKEDQTMLEEIWEYQIISTDLENDTHHGEFSTNFFFERLEGQNFYIGSGFSGEYSFMQDLELWGSVGGGILDEKVGLNMEKILESFDGGMKYKFYDQNDLKLAASGYVSYFRNRYDPTDGPTYGVTIYSEKDQDANLTFHNNLALQTENKQFRGTLTNGLAYTLDKKSAIKAYLNSNFTQSFDTSFFFSGMYKRILNEKTTYLGEVYTSFGRNSLRIANTLETKVTPDFIVTGQVYLSQSKPFIDACSINLEKEYGKLKVSNQLYLPTPSKSYFGLTYNATAKYELTKDFDLKLDLYKSAERYDFGFDTVEWYKDLYTSVGVSYEL